MDIAAFASFSFRKGGCLLPLYIRLVGNITFQIPTIQFLNEYLRD